MNKFKFDKMTSLLLFSYLGSCSRPVTDQLAGQQRHREIKRRALGPAVWPM
jgi:hypothetical protein